MFFRCVPNGIAKVQRFLLPPNFFRRKVDKLTFLVNLRYYNNQIYENKSIIRSLSFLCDLGGVLNAQITTGEPTSKVIRTGNRAQAGDFGFYVGASTTMFKNIFDGDVEIVPLPLLNLKYMATDNFEIRVGLETYRLNEQLSGTQDLTAMEMGIASIENKRSQTTFMLYPGFAYHFSRLNILDVYFGVELPLGWDSSTYSSVQSIYSSSTTKRSFVLGLGAFIGFQAFIADLPIALGLEYGFSTRLDTGLKYKDVVTDENGMTMTSYRPSEDFKNIPQDSPFIDLKARRGELGGQLRLTLSYYFK